MNKKESCDWYMLMMWYKESDKECWTNVEKINKCVYFILFLKEINVFIYVWIMLISVLDKVG